MVLLGRSESLESEVRLRLGGQMIMTGNGKWCTGCLYPELSESSRPHPDLSVCCCLRILYIPLENFASEVNGFPGLTQC
ncbi:hypothetical protein MHYP_G00031770 [Metynnis hypsauchen]